jgi:signal transduction histidine kinase
MNNDVAKGNHRAVAAIKARPGGAGKRAREPEPHTRKRSVQDLSVSSRLIAVIVLALVMGLVFGGLRVADAAGSADQFGRVTQLAKLGEQAAVVVQDLQNERDETAAVISGASAAVLKPLYATTGAAVATFDAQAAGIGGGFPANIQSATSTVVTDLQNLSSVRNLARAEGNPTAVITDYAQPITDIDSLNSEIAQGVSDPTLTNDVRALDSLYLAKEEVTEQRALLFNALTQGFFSIGVEEAINTAASQEALDETAFQSAATPTQQSAFAAVTGSSQVSDATNIENFMVSDSDPFTDIVNLGIPLNKAPSTWYSLMSFKVDQMQAVAQSIAANVVTRAQSLQSGAKQSAVIAAVLTLAVLLIVLIATFLVARSLVRPLRRLRAGALHIATVQLPERVQRISEAENAESSMAITPIDVVSADEIGQVARAFDQVHAEAVRLAGNEAMLRTSFNAMFVNLSRRSQSLIERLARRIEALEQNEDDPDRLSELFSMDHLVTRMRRNSENLLLLAGHEGARKWSESVPLADVARAATSEIEQYSRVVLNVEPGIAVVGQAVSDVVHLLAELIENATLYSPKDTQVHVSAQELTSGGVLIEISDKGIGVSEARLAEMNWRLDNPPVIDVSVSRHMGLFAVARLAERHRIRIRLRPATPQGLTALVWLPDKVVERTSRGYAAPAGAWSNKPFSARQSLPTRRSAGRQSIGTRTAVEGRRAAVAEASAQAGADVSGAVQEEQPMSNWFRSRRISATGVGSGNAGRSMGAQSGWNGPAGGDPLAQGRHAAEIIADPIRGEQTSAGLPLRVPKANLIPGSASGHEGIPSQSQSQSPLPNRSAEVARSRLSGFQRGARRAEGRRSSAGEGTNS